MIIKLMWILVSFCSAFFAGITSVLIKLGIKKTDSDIALAMRTVVILIFSIAVTAAFGTQKEIFSVNGKKPGCFSFYPEYPRDYHGYSYLKHWKKAI
ncbi:MAG: hypothetical protein K2N67_03355 [Mucispirillum sp.]|nr:hypothetical protein [Mucispirillum sp.]